MLKIGRVLLTDIIIIICKGVTPAGSTQTYYIAGGGQEKRKDRKTRKSRSEEKMVGFISASLFPTRKWEAVTQGGTI